MTQAIKTLTSQVGAYLVEDTDCNGTGYIDFLTGKTTITIYQIEIDNTANSATSYFKMWVAAAPTVNTDAPDLQIPVLAGKKVTVNCIGGLDGVFTVRASMACVQEAGTGGNTNPTSPVIVRVLYDFT